MRRRLSRWIPIAITLALAVPALLAQDANPPDTLAAARRIMERARYCSMITIGPDGRAEARIVDPFSPEEGMTVWIATNPLTRKVDQIRKNPHVTLLYWDAEGVGYVTLIGDAVVVEDPAEKAKRWKADWKAFYADENRGADYVLIRVRPRRLEIVSKAEGIGPADPKNWRPLQHEFK